jgi:hypothetical protein
MQLTQINAEPLPYGAHQRRLYNDEEIIDQRLASEN